MQIFVRYNGGALLGLDVDAGDGIEVVKAQIQSRIGTNGRQILKFNGVTLLDGNSLADYNVHRESVLDLTYSMQIKISAGVTIGAGVTVKVPVLPPPPPKSLSFNGTQGTQLDVLGNTADWALGISGTIEWWQKTAASSTFPGGGFNGGIFSQGAGAGSGNGIDLFQAGGMNTDLGANSGAWPDPPPNVWSHIAVTLVPVGQGAQAHLYINGIEQGIQAGYGDSNLRNSTDILHIGCRIPDVNYQNWTGLITNIHVNTNTLYTGNFTPSIITTPIAGSVLLLTADDILIDKTGRHTTSGNVTVVEDAPT
jgi:hypothetical protein